MPPRKTPKALAIVGSTARIDEQENNDRTSSPGTALNKHIRNNNESRLKNDSLGSPLSPLSPTTPKSPRSPFKFSLKPASHSSSNSARPPMQVSDAQQQNRLDETRIELPASPTAATSTFHPDSSPAEVTGPNQEGSKRQGKGGFFSNYKASKSSSKVNANRSQMADESTTPDREINSQLEMISKGTVVSSAAEAKNNGSEPKKTVTRRPVKSNAKSSDVSLALSTDSTASDANAQSTMASTQTATATVPSKKNKGSPFGILGRSRSTRDKDKNRERERENNRSETKSPRQQSPSAGRSTNGRSTPTEHNEPRQPQPVQTQHDQQEKLHDRKLVKESTMDGSSLRQRSQDRKPMPARENTMAPAKDHIKSQPSISSNGGNGGNFLSNLNPFNTKAADKLHKSILSKVGRSGSTNEKEFHNIVDNEHYVFKVLNLPLYEQTRQTRISKRLEESRDKTEFWMPSFPWRAIDYLNYKGCEVEGLYRVPGSGPQIKLWQRKFDEELDVDLFAQEDLYDINIIGSMLKQWLRELPDELLPKASQDRVARDCAKLNITSDMVESVEVPQSLIDELSNLPPFNYYLLFAITCHLSLLLNHSDKNKMDFRNLCICFQPCMKMDALCFKFLVCDWRSCWKGCKTEAEYVEREYKLFDYGLPTGKFRGEPPLISRERGGRSSPAVESTDERNVSSSGSSKPSSVSVVAESTGSKSKSGGMPLAQKQNQGAGNQQVNHGHGTTSHTSKPPSALTFVSSNVMTPRTTPESDMRPLSPIKPLSPMGL